MQLDEDHRGRLLRNWGLLGVCVLVHLGRGQILTPILKSCWVQAIAMRFTDKEFESVKHQREQCRNSVKYAHNSTKLAQSVAHVHQLSGRRQKSQECTKRRLYHDSRRDRGVALCAPEACMLGRLDNVVYIPNLM